ncbi:AI-2E family transporter [Candidatus Schneideria nysicola]|uniref:AI-2E family transporter n=1 Tax=Candidatus Schneideria nysicola TaxID=1081631 RepID=UPI001CAA806E|nr:AI-2E family transporter [Candidatus Schneideria nysicola]UAJ66299.1 AI-2E family transporter [Candidatus Schneideria nysicola]
MKKREYSLSIDKKKLQITSYLLMFIFIILIIPLRLFPCFIAGLLTHEIIILLTPLFEKLVGIGRARWVVVGIITTFFSIILVIGILNVVNFLTSDILQKEIDISIETSRILNNVKNHIKDYFPFFPRSVEELKDKIFFLVESNLAIIRNMSTNFLHGLITIFVGFVMGIIISLQKNSEQQQTYFIKQILKRLYYLSQAFRNIVFAQIKVSIINTILTSIMILIIFPLCNIFLPLGKTLIIFTFIFGLLPIVGNLLSNVMIIMSSLSISLTVGGIMLIYLIFIHKLEYFLNAEIIANRIKAKSWELLLAMLMLEAIFGMEGLVAAPIYYAYLKIELRELNLI